jgi:hypothetical protein
MAVALVNRRDPEILETFRRHHAADYPDCADGATAAETILALAAGSAGAAPDIRDAPERLFSASPENTAAALACMTPRNGGF